MKSIFFIITILLLLTGASCKEKNNSIYEGCCGTAPITDSISMTIKHWNDDWELVDTQVIATLYIPNIFTPDSSYWDNSNFIVCSAYVEKIISAKYYDASGELLFERGSHHPCDTGVNWHGEKTGGGFYYGVFEYQIVVKFINGDTKTYINKACSYQCNEDGFPEKNLPDCAFPNQHDGIGGFDQNLYNPQECF